MRNKIKTRGYEKYRCIACDYIYDPALGSPEDRINSGTPFEELPDSWTCPICSVGKDLFEKVQYNRA